MRKPWWPAIGLMLIFGLTRLTELDAWPVFIDEGVHIRWARLVWAGQSLTAAADGRLLHVWWLALFWPFKGGLWLSRAVMVLWGLLTIAALVALGRRLRQPGGGVLAAALYVLAPMAFFYDRMALTDTMQVALHSLLLLASVALVQRPRWWLAAVVAGLMLSQPMTKLPGVFWLGTPAFALLMSDARQRGQAAWHTAASYALFALSFAAVVAALQWRGVGYFDLAQSNATGGSLSALPALLGSQALAFVALVPPYLPGVLGLLLLLGIGLGLWHRRLTGAGLLLMALVPTVALAALAGRFQVRYVIPALPPLLLLAGLGWAAQSANWSYWQRRWAAVGALALVLASGTGAFAVNAWWNPATTRLGDGDTAQYLRDWSAGYGLDVIADDILASAARTPTDLVVIEPTTLPMISVYFGAEPHLYALYDYDEPDLRIKLYYAALTDPFASLASPDRAAYLLVLLPDDAQRLAELRAGRELVREVARPGGGAYQLYRIWPDPPR